MSASSCADHALKMLDGCWMPFTVKARGVLIVPSVSLYHMGYLALDVLNGLDATA
jgi:hypothetical protein